MKELETIRKTVISKVESWANTQLTTVTHIADLDTFDPIITCTTVFMGVDLWCRYHPFSGIVVFGDLRGDWKYPDHYVLGNVVEKTFLTRTKIDEEFVRSRSTYNVAVFGTEESAAEFMVKNKMGGEWKIFLVSSDALQDPEGSMELETSSSMSEMA